MAAEPLKVACIGMGWWSDVLADAMKRSGQFEIAACYTRSEGKRRPIRKGTALTQHTGLPPLPRPPKKRG